MLQQCAAKSMAAEFHQRVREVFDRMLERPVGDRSRFLTIECAGEPRVLEAVNRLLQAQAASDTFLSTGTVARQRIGRYLLNGELGRGGMGVVYDAMDPVIERSVALKVINLATGSGAGEAETLRERLFKEARSCGRLSHPAIVIIFDVGQEGESAFIAMERVDGPSLHKMLDSGVRLGTKEALRILKETAGALDYAHQHGVVHRDIKPGNIMLRGDGAVKVADFGIAKVISSQQTTTTGVIMGTPSYMSPEQIAGRQVDGRSDQFSLAVLAYELLAGELPFRAESLPTIAHLIVYGARPSPRTRNADLPAGVDAVFQRALARMAEDRFASCCAFVEALEAALGGVPAIETPMAAFVPAQAPRPAAVTVEPQRAKQGRVKPVIFAGLAALVLLGLGAAFYFHQKASHGTNTEAASAPVAGKPQFSGPASAPPPIPAAEPVAVPSGPPVVKQFHVDESIKAGQPATLSWEVTDAEKVKIEPGIGTVAPKSMAVEFPTVTTTYTLTASSGAGTQKKTARVKVEPDSVPVRVRVKMLNDDAEAQRKQGHLGEAIRLVEAAAALGDTAAMVELGDAYSTDTAGVPQDGATAMAWYRKAAERGNPEGMVRLGGMYEIGIEGVEADDAEAARWFQKAAEQNDASAMYDLGTLYEHGQGVLKSVDKAREWYVKSAGLGNTEAKKRLAQMAGK